MTLEFILRAAASSMIKGHHQPHYFTAHTPGLGYVNHGLGPVENRADYLQQLERAGSRMLPATVEKHVTFTIRETR